ncbi:MAG: gamma-glutamyltransferase [Cyclobacteriaceae bacterium]
MMKRLTLLLPVIIAVSCTEKSKPESYTGLLADSAMVVSAHPLASQVGVEIMRKGGNAVDAAVAVQLALAVVFPEAGNIGGGGFMLMRDANGNATALDYREKAPGAAFRDMYLDSAGNVRDGLSTYGHLASGVPGSVDGMVTMHEKYGALPWKDLVQPAIDLALKGYPLTKRASENLNDIQEDLKKYNSILPEYLIKTWKENDTIQWIDLGHTLERIRDEGRKGFYEGKTADDIIAEIKRGNGIITLDDLKNYKSRWLNPVISYYKEYKIISMPPPSSGGVALSQLLKSVEPYPIRSWGHNNAKTIHLLTEAERRVYADRAGYLGDPDFFTVPVQKLIDERYIRQRMKTFDPAKATPSAQIKNGSIAGYEPTETTHISIVDPAGNAVAVTTTINDWFGSRVVVAGSGFFLNDEMDDFSMKPGVPNLYGVTGGKANEIQPGKTMLSSMTPTIVEKDNRLFMVVGSPGGSRIITAVFQVILNVVDHGMGMQEAVDAKRTHAQWLPDTIFTERGALQNRDSIELISLGHKVIRSGSFGRVDAILKLKSGKLEAGADRLRGDDTAVGF